jgi:hypothetical protein
VSLVVGVAYSIWLGDQTRFPDEVEYLQLASSLANRSTYSYDGETPSTFRPPGYVFFLSIPAAVSNNVIALRSINFVAYSTSIVLAFLLSRRIGGQLTAALTVLLIAAYPVLFFTAGTLYPQTLASALFLGFLNVAAMPRITGFAAIVAGILMGLLVLTIPTFILSCTIVILWCIWQRRFASVRWAILIPVVCMLVVGMWSLRNFSVTDRLVPISSNSGINLLLGNSENTEANSGPTTDISKYVAETDGMNEVEKDEYFRHAAFDYVKDHPTAAFRTYLAKVANYFNFRNDLHTQSESSRLKDLVLLVSYGAIGAFAVSRVILSRRYPMTPFEKLLLALYLVNALWEALVFTRIRYRLPYDFLVAILAASALSLFVKSGSDFRSNISSQAGRNQNRMPKAGGPYEPTASEAAAE